MHLLEIWCFMPNKYNTHSCYGTRTIDVGNHCFFTIVLIFVDWQNIIHAHVIHLAAQGGTAYSPVQVMHKCFLDLRRFKLARGFPIGP